MGGQLLVSLDCSHWCSVLVLMGFGFLGLGVLGDARTHARGLGLSFFISSSWRALLPAMSAL